jgi:hypothetical protein
MAIAVIRRRDVANIKAAYHKFGIKRLPTLAALESRGIVRQLGRGTYRLAKKRKPMGAV